MKTLWEQGYVTLEETEKGDLKIAIRPEYLEELREESGYNPETGDFEKDVPDLYEILEFPLCNGWEMVAPERIGALTEAPIITNCLCEYSEDDPEYGERDFFGHPKIKSLETVWWYPNYMVSDPVEELLREGYVIFTSDKNS